MREFWFDERNSSLYDCRMTEDTRQVMKQIIAYCNDKWLETERGSPSGFPTVDMQTGKKMAYNDVLQYARTILEEMTAHGSKPDGASSGP